MTTPDEPILRVTAGSRVTLWLRFFPLPSAGALILTPSRLRLESVDSPALKREAREMDIPTESIADARIETWPSILRVALALTWLTLWPALRRGFQANLTIEAQSGTYHLRVRDPEGWVQALRDLGESGD